MKVKLIIWIVVLAALFASFIIIVRLATPEVWPIPAGTLKAAKITVNGHDFVMVDGDGINQLGQIQSIAFDVDAGTKKIFVNRYLIRWNPFTKITVNNQWPVVLSLEGLKAGQYSVVYTTKEGEGIAGTVDVH